MTNSVLHNETYIQVKLLEFIEKKFKNKIHYAALEARYSHNDRRADVVVISENRYTHAYEIKSEIDALDRLVDQMKDYRRTFDYVTVVTTPKHIRKIKKLLSKNDGLIVLSNELLIELKEPVRNRKFFKRNLIAMCSKSALMQALDIKGSNQKLELVYNLAERTLLIPDLKRIIISEFKRRFKSRYDQFNEEARLPYREEDLYPLKAKNRLTIDFV